MTKRLKSAGFVTIEIIFRPREKLSINEQKRTIQEMAETTTKSWGDFGETVNQWFELADILLVARKDKEMIAFSAVRFESKDLIMPLSVMVIPQYQNVGLNQEFQKIVAWEFLRKRIKMNGFKIWKYFRNVCIVFRTPNPRVVNAIRKFGFAIALLDYIPTYQERRIAENLVKMFSKKITF